ncbi:hypothetical protein JTB14_010311 [Gonioctena quinquepunctata]|nr:hypothetical protein JTB14_010311 [Gonioctena quinquepunctata]
MGIRGLTTFISNNSNILMENHELHDTDVVFDGDSLLHHLYSVTKESNECFGGDYDKFANTIYDFFKILSDCKITPYIIIDGGYEPRKMDTIKRRFKDSLQKAKLVNPNTYKNSNFHPLLMKEVFEDILIKEKIKFVRTDFEADRETASIAKILNCPVISHDSDFFIFDVPYIPLPTMKMKVKRSVRINPNTQAKTSYKYISCEIYKVINLLQYLGLEREKLPLLAAVIGNDYISGISISQLNLQMERGIQNISQERIDILISWLCKETKQSAIKKLVDSYSVSEKTLIAKQMQDAMEGYSLGDSKYIKYLVSENEIKISSISKSMNSTFNVFEKMAQHFPRLFIENYRRCLYPTRIMDILTHNKYFRFRPQIELYRSEHSHTLSIEIVSAIHRILRGPYSDNLVCLVRVGEDIAEQKLPICNLNIPSFENIQKMDVNSRKNLIWNILDMNECVDSYPNSWHLFIITLKYMINKSVISWSLVYALVFCKILLSYADPKIGFYRSVEEFDCKYRDRISHIPDLISGLSNSIKKALSDITFEDSLLSMGQAITYFEMDDRLKRNINLFDKELIHTLSQFQSVLLHVKCLNQLLNMPFSDVFLAKCYNGTFLYNFTKELMKQNDIEEFMRYGLRNSRLILHSFQLIINTLRKGEN